MTFLCLSKTYSEPGTHDFFSNHTAFVTMVRSHSSYYAAVLLSKKLIGR